MRKLIVSTCLIFLASPVVAQDLPPLFRDYITKNTTYTTQLNKKTKALFNYTFPQCDEDITIARLKPTLMLTPQHDESQDVLTTNPHYGQWVESATGSACGEKIKFNILSTAYNVEHVPLLYPLTNGNTKIEVILQSNAAQAIEEQLSKAKNCRAKKVVINTVFYGYRTTDTAKLSAKDQNMGWLEQWDVDACGKIESVNLAILPDPRTRYKYVAKVKP